MVKAFTKLAHVAIDLVSANQSLSVGGDGFVTSAVPGKFRLKASPIDVQTSFKPDVRDRKAIQLSKAPDVSRGKVIDCGVTSNGAVV